MWWWWWGGHYPGYGAPVKSYRACDSLLPPLPAAMAILRPSPNLAQSPAPSVSPLHPPRRCLSRPHRPCVLKTLFFRIPEMGKKRGRA